MDDMCEFIILQTEHIRITNRKAIIGWKTYEISKNTSVGLGEKHPSPFAGKTPVVLSLISFLIGILSCLGALSIRFISIVGDFVDRSQIILHFLVAVIGLIFIYIGSLGWESDKPTYLVRIETESGTSNILEDKDKNYVERIINAIHDAIARRMNDF